MKKEQSEKFDQKKEALRLKQELKNSILSNGEKIFLAYGQHPTLYHTVKKTNDEAIITGWCPETISIGDFFDLGVDYNLYKVKDVKTRDHAGIFSHPDLNKNSFFTIACQILNPVGQ